jgi:hypothetical protein
MVGHGLWQFFYGLRQAENKSTACLPRQTNGKVDLLFTGV